MRRIGGLALVAAVLVGGLAACGSDDPSALSPSGPTATVDQPDTCDWTMAGQNLARTHASTCGDGADRVGRDTLDRLTQVWFARTRAEVTGAPAVTDDALFFGDWSGRIYSLDRRTGKERWTRDTPVNPVVYAGQITASPSLATLADGTEVVVIASAATVWVLRQDDGSPVWNRTLTAPGAPSSAGDPDPTEIEGAPTVAGGLVIVPTDVHNDKTRRSGVVALDLADGAERWRFDPEGDKPAGGCGSVWGTASVDLEEELVVFGTGSCFRETSWTRWTEAIVGVDLRTGEPRWSFQPRPFGGQDWDFAGAPNLYEIAGRKVAGLGNKDGHYYVVDRETGKLVWKAEAVRQTESGDGFAFGGFIGATSVAADTRGRLVVSGGTAVGDCPCQHGFDAATGEALWQSSKPTGTYGASGASGGVVFTAGVDQTLRAFDLTDGKVVWDHPLPGLSASGAAIAGDLLAIGVGFREPGSDSRPSGGVAAFRVLAEGEEPPPSSTTTAPPKGAVTALAPSQQACVGAPCDLDFTLKDPPKGRKPTMTLEVTPDPLAITVRTTDLGDPADWLGEDGPAAETGASAFGVFITPSDDKPELGSIVCILDDSGSCTGRRIGLKADGYTRISLLALADESTPPTLQEGFDRLVTTHSFDQALVPAS